MSRVNLEDNLARRIRHTSAMFSNTHYVLSGTYIIGVDGSQFHFLDAGGADRAVFMPPLEVGGGQFYVIANIGVSGSLNLLDSHGVSIAPVAPGTTALLISSSREWNATVSSPVGSNAPVGASFVTRFSEPGLTSEWVLSNSATLTWDFSTPGQARANVVVPPGITITGTPFSGQLAQWTGPSSLQGVNGSAIYQPLDGDLTALAALGGIDVIYYRSGVNTWSPISIGSGISFSGGTLSAVGFGNISSSGIPLSGQLARWTDATHVEGIDVISLGFATLASPNFTGDPRAPTPSLGDNDTSVATTAFVQSAIATAPSGFTTGDAKLTFKTNADPGWIIANDGSIGNAASGATTRNNADTIDLFTLLWNNISTLVVQNSGGATVARGANAAADFAANRRLVIPAMLGRALASAGAGSGLTVRQLGVQVGAETETQSLAKLVSHSHLDTVGGGFINNSGANANVTFAGPDSISGTNIANSGGGAPLNIMQPTQFLWVMIKL